MSTAPPAPEHQASTLDVLLALTRLETKLDATLAQAADHETRLRTLERARWPLPSAAVLLSLAGVGVSVAGLTLR